MIFRRSKSNETILNLNADAIQTNESAMGVLVLDFVDNNQTLTIEEKVKQHFEQLREPIYRYLVASFGMQMQAEEIVQEAFLKLYISLSEGQTIHNVKAWTFRVAHNLAINQIKTRQFIEPLDDSWAELQQSLEDKALNPEQTLLKKEKLSSLRKAISRLTLIERECLNLRTKGFRYREIGEILDIGTTTVADILGRVVEKLAKDTNE